MMDLYHIFLLDIWHDLNELLRKMRMKRKAYFTFTKHSQNSILGATEKDCANANLKCISENKK